MAQGRDKRFAVHTLGCKVNQYESQALREGLLAAGWREAPSGPVDVQIINTCSVTARADGKGRAAIRAARRRAPNATIIVTGCQATRDPEGIRAMPEVDYLFTNEQKHRILAWLLEEEKELRGQPGFGTVFDLKISHFSGRTRAFVKIQDGCDVYCTFCIIPFLRGPFRSRPVGDVVAEVERLVANGFREIVLTGICLGQYGREAGNGSALADLIARLDAVPGLERLRLSSIEAHEITEPVIEAARAARSFCPHFHIPLQSGSDRVRKWMNRPRPVAQYLEVCRRLQDAFDRPAISADIIVGFPRETEADFEQTLEVAEQVGFSKIHVFPYSDREGTAAARMQPKVPPEEIRRRRDRLLALEERLARAFKEQFCGEIGEVLVEEGLDRETGRPVGFTRRYLRVLLDPEAARLAGRTVRVRLERGTASFLEGRCVPGGAAAGC